MKDKNIYKVGDTVSVASRSSRHNDKHGIIERVLYKVRFDDGGDSTFVEDSLVKDTEVAQEEYMMSKSKGTEGMKQDLIDKVYDLGFEAGKESEAIAIQDAQYQRGLDDAWECVKKIVLDERDGGLTVAELLKIFDTSIPVKVIRNLSASEAIEKIRQYEEQKKSEEEEIKVGDEVVFNVFNNGCIGVVVEVMLIDGKFQILWCDGHISAWDKEEIKKTGKHFPQIAEVLKQMQEGE